jgi:hypothetical protein
MWSGNSLAIGSWGRSTASARRRESWLTRAIDHSVRPSPTARQAAAFASRYEYRALHSLLLPLLLPPPCRALFSCPTKPPNKNLPTKTSRPPSPIQAVSLVNESVTKQGFLYMRKQQGLGWKRRFVRLQVRAPPPPRAPANPPPPTHTPARPLSLPCPPLPSPCSHSLARAPRTRIPRTPRTRVLPPHAHSRTHPCARSAVIHPRTPPSTRRHSLVASLAPAPPPNKHCEPPAVARLLLQQVE